MDKEQILSAINEKLGKTSLSSRTIDTYVSAHLPAEGTEPDEAYYNGIVGFLNTLNGQYSHDVAEFKKTFKPDKNVEDNHDDNTGNNDRISQLEKQIADLIASRERETAANSERDLRDKIRGKAKELKISAYAHLWDDIANELDLSDCKTEDEALTKVKQKFEGKVKSYYGDSAKPYGKTSTNPKHSEDEQKRRREAYRKQLEAEGKIPHRE